MTLPAVIKRQPLALVRPLLRGLYLLIVVGPLLVLVSTLVALPLPGWADVALPTIRQVRLWARSVALAGAVATTGITLGLLVALARRRRGSGRLAGLRRLFILWAPVPPVIHAMAWSWAMGQLNRALTPGGLGPIALQGWVAAWAVQVFWLLPIAIGLALVATASVDRRLTEAGRLLQSDVRTLGRIEIPLAAPVLLAGGGLLFVLSLVDYAIPSLCQINVTALDIFADFSVHNSPGRALLVSVPLLVTTATALGISQSRLRSVALDPNWHRSDAGAPTLWPPLLQTAVHAAILVALLAVAVPLISLAAEIGSLSQLVATLSEARSEIAGSLTIATATGLLSLPIAYGVARACATPVDRGSRHTRPRLWWLALTLPLALPGPLVGIGLIALWNRPGWRGMGPYGTIWMPVLAALARYAPIGALILVAALRRQNPRLIEAAQLLETRRLRTWLMIQIPLLAPGLLAAAGIVFSLTLGELSATLLVAPPGRPTLTMRIYNYLHYGASGTVAGLTLVLTGLVLAFGLLVAAGLAIWGKLTAVEESSLPQPASPVGTRPRAVLSQEEADGAANTEERRR